MAGPTYSYRIEDPRQPPHGIPEGQSDHQADVFRSAAESGWTRHPDGYTARTFAAYIAIRTGGMLPDGLTDKERRDAQQLALRSFPDVVREMVLADGLPVSHVDSENVRTAVEGVIATNAFSEAMTAMLVSSFDALADSTDWCSTQIVDSYKTQIRPRHTHSTDETPKPVGRGGTAPELHLDTADAEVYAVARFAQTATIDEMDILNDNLALFREISRTLSQGAARLRPDSVYYHLLSNPDMADGEAIISAAHVNNGSSALDSSNLAAAVKAMRTQTEGGINLDINPTHLIVAPELEETARKLIRDRDVGDGGGLLLRVEPRLETGAVDPISGVNVSGSTTAWYLADRNAAPIEVGVLSPRPSIRRFPLTKGGQWGVAFDVAWSLGVKAVRYHSIYRGNT